MVSSAGVGGYAVNRQAGTVRLDKEKHMFRVEVDSLKDYLDFDLSRKSDLQNLDKFISRSAPGLKRYFHRGTPVGQPGMRFKMIGYGKFQYVARTGNTWIGLRESRGTSTGSITSSVPVRSSAHSS